MKLILASTSPTRRAMLDAAGVPFEARPPQVDEESLKAALCRDSIAPRDLADALAEAKAVALSRRDPEAMVLGCDQVAVAADGTLLDKPGSREGLRIQLSQLRGSTHRQLSAVVIAEAGRPVWRHVDEARLTMRDFSDVFLEDYLDAEGAAASGCVGGYRIEAMGVQLFSQIEGSHFTILGLPLMPVLDYLRTRAVIAT
jgi:septum formation protein